MGLREGVLREGYAPQASPARGAPQHRLTKTSGEYVYPYLEGDERAAAAGGRGTSFAAPLTRLAALRTLPTVSCVPRCARNLSPAGPAILCPRVDKPAPTLAAPPFFFTLPGSS